MKSYRKELWMNTDTRRAYLNITPQINECLKESGIKEGLLLCNAMHITASVFINDDESGLHADFDRWLEKLAPEKPYDQYQHNGFGRQRRCPFETFSNGTRSRRCNYKRQIGFRSMGTNLLR